MLLVVLLGSLGACAADDGLEPGVPRDSGRRDTLGPPPDTGVPPLDTGIPPVDTGGVPPDTGAPPVDTGAPMDRPTPMDTGVPPPDTRPPPPDTAPPPPDTRPLVDTAPAMDTEPPPFDAPEVVRDADPRPHDTELVVGGAPADSASRFAGMSDATRAPSIVYPSDGVVLPPNLGAFEVHFRPGAGNDLFAVTFTGDRGALRIFTRCTAVGGGCVLSMDTAALDELYRVAQPGGTATLVVRGTSSTSPGRVGSSAAQTVGVTPTDLRGGLYYWAAGAGAILRYEWGLPGARPERYLTGDPLNCVGCHALSRDGRRIAVGRFIPGPARSNVYETSGRRAISPDFGANFFTFSPDNARMVMSDGARLSLIDPNTGAALPGLPPGTTGSMPDWSRDGRALVASRTQGFVPPFFGQPGHNGPADLLVFPWSGTAFGAASTLVRGSGMENNYYPAFSPDNNWVLFNRANGESYNNIGAHLYAVRAAGGAPVRLAAADGAGELGNSWPKWAPFVQMYQGSPLLWLTFASRRDYGLRLQQQTAEPERRTAQLWMAAFRPDRPGDPSAPAFWLPFQDLGVGNHIAQWAEVILRQGCRDDRDCAAMERCRALPGRMACLGN